MLQEPKTKAKAATMFSQARRYGLTIPGPAASPAPRPGPAAGGCAFDRMRGSASRAIRSHPRRLVCCHPWQHTVPAWQSRRASDRVLVGRGEQPGMARLYPF